MRQQKFDGIVIKSTPYKDADAIVTIFTKDAGRRAFLAKGIRKPSSRKRGHMGVFSYIRFETVGGDFPLITEVSTVRSYKNIRLDITKISVAYYMAEVIYATCEETVPYPRVFNLLASSLQELQAESNMKKIRMNFGREMLVLLGFWPEERPLENPDPVLEEVMEKKLASVRIGKQMQAKKTD